MTTLASKAMNAMPTLLLRSPLHTVMSSRYLLLTFTGRKSGQQYTTPVAYVRDGDRLLISTDSPWGSNVTGGRTVTVRLRDRTYDGAGHRLTNPTESEAAMRALLNIPGYARAAEVDRTHGITTEQIQRAAAERTVIAIDLVGPA